MHTLDPDKIEVAQTPVQRLTCVAKWNRLSTEMQQGWQTRLEGGKTNQLKTIRIISNKKMERFLLPESQGQCLRRRAPSRKDDK